MTRYVVVGSNQEAACRTRGIRDAFAAFGAHHVDDCVNQGPWSEVRRLELRDLTEKQGLEHRSSHISRQRRPDARIDEFH